MFSARDRFKLRLDELGDKISDRVDFDFSAVSKKINTIDEFNSEILSDFLNRKQLFYRGERINSPQRNLLPTLFRNPSSLFEFNDLGIVHIDGEFLLKYYSSLGRYVEVFSNTIGKADCNNLYELCAFSQHYFNVSPLIDFTKNLYTSLSFALKDREHFDDDIVLYTVELKNQDDYTDDINVANQWLRDIDVYVSTFQETDIKNIVKEIIENKNLLMSEEFRHHMEQINTSRVPKAKLIDVPTNTRMKFQQGVFLMLTDFQLFNVKYFTKNIREHFIVTKFIVNKEICPDIVRLIKEQAPWYSYKYLTNVDVAFDRAKRNIPF